MTVTIPLVDPCLGIIGGLYLLAWIGFYLVTQRHMPFMVAWFWPFITITLIVVFVWDKLFNKK